MMQLRQVALAGGSTNGGGGSGLVMRLATVAVVVVVALVVMITALAPAVQQWSCSTLFMIAVIQSRSGSPSSLIFMALGWVSLSSASSISLSKGKHDAMPDTHLSALHTD